MGNRIILCAIVLFALAFARANVYAQFQSADTVGKSIRTDMIDSRDLWEGIDSLLKSHGLTVARVRIVCDTLDRRLLSRVGFPTSNSNSTQLIIDHIFGYKKFFKGGWHSKDLFNGRDIDERVVAVDGKIEFSDSSHQSIPFSFTRTLTLIPLSDDHIPEFPESFWDSTAKPILVTLGAAAVIALFFLVRG